MRQRSVVMAVAVVLVVSVAGCSSEDSFAVEFSHPQEHGAIPFAATGLAVDESALCDGGTMAINHLESMEGNTITEADWAEMFDAASANNGIAEMYVMQDFVCEDGSGSFTMAFHNRFDFTTFEFEGQQDVGTWEIEKGTGGYTDLSGSGDAMLDFDKEEVTYSGEVQPS